MLLSKHWSKNVGEEVFVVRFDQLACREKKSAIYSIVTQLFCSFKQQYTKYSKSTMYRLSVRQRQHQNNNN
jgi:hypothetical protein